MDWQFEVRSSVLLQNCDLPPPLKIFSPLEKEDTNKRIIPNPEKIIQWDDEVEPNNHQTDQNTSLLRALRLSQSRAREAEKKASMESNTKEQVTKLLLEESLKLSAHRRWTKLLEIEVSLLHQKKKKRKRLRIEGEFDDYIEDEDEDVDSPLPALTWCLTLALCLGIGFALGRYVF